MKSWQEKLDNGREPKVVTLDKEFGGMPVGTNMLVSTPREVDSFLRKIPMGQSVTQQELRLRLAAKHGRRERVRYPRGFLCASPPRLPGSRSAPGPTLRRLLRFGEPLRQARRWRES